MQVTYSGNQLNGATSNWGSADIGDSLMITADTTTGAPFASFALGETPIAASTAVLAPSSLWFSLAGILAFGLMSVVRKTIKTRA